jgi:hypothetical protein
MVSALASAFALTLSDGAAFNGRRLTISRWSRRLWVLAVAVPIAGSAPGKGKVAASEEKASPRTGVNWAGQVIQAVGSGAPDLNAVSPAQARLGAEHAAQQDAFRSLLEQVKPIRITAGRTVADEMQKQEVREKIEAAIKAFKITRKRYYSDGGLEIDVEVPLSALNEALLSTASGTAVSATAASAIATPAGAVKADRTAKNTGLVVDARGVPLAPALAPRLLDEAGQALYGAEVLSQEARKSRTVAAWVTSLEEAKKHERAGRNPLVVKAAKAIGTDLVIAHEDAKKLSESNNAFLAEGRVVIVTR